MKNTVKRLFAFILAAVMIALAALSLVACGTETVQGEKGDQGAQGEQGAPGKDGETPFVGDNGNWWIGSVDTGISASGKDGRDGADGQNGQAGAAGADGEPGADGVTPLLQYNAENKCVYVSYDDKETWEKLLSVEELVTEGADGVGINEMKINDKGELEVVYSTGDTKNLGKIVAADGKNGTDGKDGVGISSIKVDEKGELVVTLTDEKTLNLGVVKGKDGVDGKDGVSVSDIEVDKNGNLIVTLSDETVLDLGCIKGKDGVNGVDGLNGENGKNGADGEDGVTPQLKIDAETNEWMIKYDGEWERLGVCASGADAEMPRLRINGDGEWQISYTNGATWQDTGVSAKGEDGKDGTNGKDGVGISNVEINDKGELVISLSSGKELNLGTVKGTDGKDGTNGKDGKDGITPQLRIDTDSKIWQISYDGGEKWESLGVSSTGTNGVSGKDGVTPQLKIGELSKNWMVSYDNGKTWEDLGVSAVGESGDKGDAGRGIQKVEVIDGFLFVTYTDSLTPVNVGKVSSETEGGETPDAPTSEPYTDGLAFYPIGDGSEYGVSVGYAKYMENIIIPSVYNGKPVTTILAGAFAIDSGDGSFAENLRLVSVIIPDGIKKIEANAFACCSRVEQLIIPASIECIEENAFIGVSSIYIDLTQEECDANGWTSDMLGYPEIEYGGEAE